MISKGSRLPAAGFRSSGYESIRTPYFLLKAKKNNTAKNRIGVVVGVAVHKSAAKRNFWKRQAKTQLMKLNENGYDILLIPNAKVNGLTRKEFGAVLTDATKRIK
jgi:ribonuclease P protein component